MKLLHTSDWHVGKAIRGHSRADEHRAVLAEIADVADQHEVELVIVAGDLFDSTVPSAESEAIVYQALLDLAGGDRRVAVIAGNHDNRRRLSALAPVLRLGHVDVVAEPARPDDGGLLAFSARDSADVRVAMLPFVSKRGIVRAEQLMANASFENAQAYAERMRVLIESLSAGFTDSTVNVFVNHSFVLGGETGGGERQAHLVEEYAVSAQSFPASIGYGALGHLHRPQRVPTGSPVYYSGSPLQLDFGEAAQTKSVNVVSLEPGVPANIDTVALSAGRPLQTITGTLDELLEMDVSEDAWLRAIVQGPSRVGLAETLRESLGDRVVDVRVDVGPRAAARVDLERLGRSPQELFAEFLSEEQIDDGRLTDLFATLLDSELDEVTD